MKDDIDSFSLPATSRGLLFEQAMKQTRMAVCLTDPHQPDNPIIFANEAFLSLSGYRLDEVVGQNCRFMQGEKTDPAMKATMRRAIKDETVIVVELMNYRKDGSSFWNALHLGPIYDENGALLYYFGSQWDVSDVHAARASEQQATLLARELSHRMKNMFSAIGSIVRISGHYENASHITDRISDRISALGRAYETTLDDAGDGSVDISLMIGTVLQPYSAARTERINVSGPSIRIDPNIISTLGLALHELATNATKYGALSVDTGNVDLSWSVKAGDSRDEIQMTWVETGGPKIASAPETSGMGSGILVSLLASIGGQISTEWRETGAVITLTLNIPKKTMID